MEDNKPLGANDPIDDLLEGELLDGKPAKKKMKKSTLIIIIIAAVIVLCCCIVIVGIIIAITTGLLTLPAGNDFMDFGSLLTRFVA